ncbi:RNA binding motif protein 12Bb [Austrofundulus limnaeus]|uniref:RNA binding motif protein 12Bb n=1 Tax=Austrofundulus limnaeus TaxID=52670 RepID=A0A2I4D4A7_AUSLI|nr:PREDICTED: RNA-binding protein 12B-like [Austrofundulus limnaeus]
MLTWSCLCFSMAVVIRLQGLSGTAGSGDIRRFFTGLKIPDGGVHIIGGKQNEAFIIFASDEDARRAMTRSGGLIKNSPITLLLSSKAEMQKLLERTAAENMVLDPKREFEDRGRQPQRCVHPEEGTGSSSQSGYTPDESQHQSPSTTEGFFGVFLKGLPYSVTKEQLYEFFYGLSIEDVLLLRHPSGRLNGMGFVKFFTRQDAVQALKRDRQYIGTRFIEVLRTYAHNWHSAVEQMQMFSDKVEDTNKVEETNKMENINKGDYFQQWRSPGYNRTNPPRDRSRSPVYQRDNATSDGEYCVMLENLSISAEIGQILQHHTVFSIRCSIIPLVHR